jgi:putative transposase
MRTAYKCRAYPNHEQVIVLNRTFGCVRAVWNRTLAWRQARYRAEHARTSYSQANAWSWCKTARDIPSAVGVK